jgi:hypothetical protein
LSSPPPDQGWGRYDKINVAYFRPRKRGPESIIENIVANQIPHFFTSEANTLWAAGSPPIGAGMPDLVAVSYEPQVFALAQVEMPIIHVLAYLRAVGCARLETIIGRTGIPHKTTLRYLNDLVELEAVARVDDTYSLLPVWRQILSEIVTIEVKVTNWKRAIDQAARNRIFSHRSFIALPDIVAKRIQSEPIFRKLGIGLLSVGDGHTVSVVRHSRYHKPRVWEYYYEIAFLAAKYGKD